MDREERKLRKEDPTAFEYDVGLFWGMHTPRDYMRARFAFIEALMQVSSRTAVQMALDHALDMLKLDRPDRIGVRPLVPALTLRLDRGQDAYDFVKWWATTGRRFDHNLKDLNIPYLDLKGDDASED